MDTRGRGFAIIALCTILTAPGQAAAQDTQTSAFAAHLSNQYRVLPNVTYHVASDRDSMLDLYLPQNVSGSVPVLVYIHGGGWTGGAKEANVLRLLPYLERGWAVVNVGYRLGQVAPAPAAVEDCLCALRWGRQQRGRIQLRYGPNCDDRPLGRWPSGPDDRHDSAGGWARSHVPR